MESAAQSILKKFGQVLVDELQEIRGVGDKVVHLRDELATMNAALRIISEAEQDSVDHLVREWEKQVHDLAYDAEDCTDTYSLRIVRPTHIPRPPPPANDEIVRSSSTTLVGQLVRRGSRGAYLTSFWARYLLSCAKRISRYPYEKLVLQRALAADIKALLARTTIVSERRVRYGIDRAALPRAAFLAPVSATSVSANALHHIDDPDQFVGIREQANTLVSMIKAPIHDQHDKITGPVLDEDDQIMSDDDKSLKVFSIVGFGGLGKTTLAMELCRQLEADFPRQAMVSVSLAFDAGKDMKGLLARLLQQILMEKADDKQTTTKVDNMDVEALSNEIKELLKQTRYLVVIDDVWNLPAWQAIRFRLPENKCSSRIIVTTRIEAVAKAAGVYFVHHMKHLDFEASKKLFENRVFGPTDHCPNGLIETMQKILTKCRGLPLAIVSIASLLASYRSAEDKDMWERVSKSIGSQMESHPSLQGMRRLITLSYDYLPHHLKACMLYMSIFPEDYLIAKHRLLYRWIIEGLVTEKRGLTMLEVAEEYLNELTSRNMIQLEKYVFTEHLYAKRVELEGCRVHDMILEVMVSKSQESNFVSLLGRQYGGIPPDHGKVRRLSIHDNDHNKQGGNKAEHHHARHGVEVTKLHHVRSLTTFRCDGHDKLLDRLGEFKLLRVLDLEDCKSLQNKHLRDVCRLHLLRFLSLRGTNISKMPSKIEKLEHLEILDIKNTCITMLPRTVTKLSKLERLKANDWLLPRGLGNMKSMCELDTGLIDGDDVPSVVQEIGELSQLEFLSIRIGMCVDNKYLLRLASSLSKTCALRSFYLERLELCCGSVEFLHSIKQPPPLLQCLSVFGRISELPGWIKSLTHLTKIIIPWPTEPSGDRIFNVLCELPNLQSVHLRGEVLSDKNLLVARTDHKFPELRILKLSQCRKLIFEEGSMTKLETLILGFSRMSIDGVKNLENLKEVKLIGDEQNQEMKLAVDQLKTLSESNKIKVVVDYRSSRYGGLQY